jgi:MoxR-like ATPase
MAVELTLKQAASLIANTGTEGTILLEGEPGIGKSMLLNTIYDMVKGTSNEPIDKVYFDCTTKDLGDFFMPRVEEENGFKVIRFSPNAQLSVHTNRPSIICFDELGKVAMRSVLNAALPILHERRVGDYQMHPKSIIFATTNLTTDGVGDMIPPHARNRMCVVKVKKPSADEWLAWAADNNIAPELQALVKQFPQMMASYTDPSQKDNHYIFHPTKQQTSFVTPRSLHKASAVVEKRHLFDRQTTMAGMAGWLGEAAARDAVAFLDVADTLPSYDSIVKDPAMAAVPKDAAAVMVVVFGLLQRIAADNMTAIMTYMNRIPKEAQAVFFDFAISGQRANIAVRNSAFKQWAADNNYLY